MGILETTDKQSLPVQKNIVSPMDLSWLQIGGVGVSLPMNDVCTFPQPPAIVIPDEKIPNGRASMSQKMVPFEKYIKPM